jgi:hypothetical protein
MMDQRQSNDPNILFDDQNLWRILIKTLLLFIVCNLIFALLDPLPALGRLSAYNLVFPGRPRLPYGEDPNRSYNLTLSQLEAMFASHEVSDESGVVDDFRVFFVGDSSVWGFLLRHDLTLAAKINTQGIRTSDGRKVRAFNLGYPTMSVTKDLLLLERSLEFEPDMIIWMITLESLPYPKQLDSPILQFNPLPTRTLIDRWELPLDPNDDRLMNESFWDRTIIGRRRQLADIFRLQMYGILWASTSIDRYLSDEQGRRMEDLPADDSFQDFTQGELSLDDLAFEVVDAGVELAGDVPVLLVNEPIFISSGENSDIRYNFYYPRWAYDEYRRLMASISSASEWNYLDLWNALPATEFTDSAIHYSADGASQLAVMLAEKILEQADSTQEE